MLELWDQGFSEFLKVDGSKTNSSSENLAGGLSYQTLY